MPNNIFSTKYIMSIIIIYTSYSLNLIFTSTRMNPVNKYLPAPCKHSHSTQFYFQLLNLSENSNVRLHCEIISFRH
jgi:hypothetical protein